ncbi:GMC oxidoreductase [Glonium stellatum]|uniref:GMC oxidoreductase n=1 Tax=Glonium stellatum TaxID=574774 RepID=A0A8E2ENY4_9PEZI|nr:GMC oxidoreductase [Glonium stellatum]
MAGLKFSLFLQLLVWAHVCFNNTYDYIIVGGGTSGLTVADRLTEDGKNSVLVIEFGYLNNDISVLIPERTLIGDARDAFNWTCVPQAGINNRTMPVPAAAVVGGGTAINGMLFDRGSKEDYDMWEALGNPGWGWAGLFPYFKKSAKFTPPLEQLVAEYGYTWDASAYGNGSIQASFPPYRFPGGVAESFWQAWKELGVPIQKEGANGIAYGAFWVPNSLDPVNETRSYARTAHYDPYKDRANYHLLTGYMVSKVIFDDQLNANSVIARSRGNNSTIFSFKAKREVILAAGSVSTTTILQRSGIGPKELLDQAKIKTRVNLPGVGHNFQDHARIAFTWNFTNGPYPNQTTLLTNATFNSEAYKEWLKFKTGPYTFSRSNSVAMLPLQTVTDDYEPIIESIKSQDAASYLPRTYDQTLINGFLAQRQLIIKYLSSEKCPIAEYPFTTTLGSITLQKPLSRGTVTINPVDSLGDPIIDWGVLTNPIDLEAAISIVKFTRKYMNSSAIQQLGPIELSPGPAVSTDDEIVNALKSSLMWPTNAHPSCTCAMMPLDKGGVVDPQLRVYGTTGLSIVDASIIPIIPATHLSATVYAIAEKAADIIKARNK